MSSPTASPARSWRTPHIFLLASVFVMSFTFATWQVLLNNFVIERANFTGVEIGMLQSLREVPGFLAFTAIFVLLIIREHYFALLSLLTLCVGVAITGFFPSVLGLYCTTVLMSIGFHYFETINKSLTLQWIDKAETPHFMGRALAVKAVASLGAYGMIWLAMEWLGVDYVWMYLLTGGIGFVVVMVLFVQFPDFNRGVVQTKKIDFPKTLLALLRVSDV